MDSWLIFFPQVPVAPSSLRVLVWRRLQQAGAINLQAGAWMLPAGSIHEQTLQKLLTQIESQGSSGFWLVAQAPHDALQNSLIARFQDERAKEYQEFGERCQEFVLEIEKETRVEKFTFAELEENEQDLLKLTRWLRKIQQRDFFKESSHQVANEAMTRCREALRVFTASVYASEGLPPISTEDELGENLDEDG